MQERDVANLVAGTSLTHLTPAALSSDVDELGAVQHPKQSKWGTKCLGSYLGEGSDVTATRQIQHATKYV